MESLDAVLSDFVKNNNIKEDSNFKNLISPIVNQMQMLGTDEMDNPFLQFLALYASSHNNSVYPITKNDYININNLYADDIIEDYDLTNIKSLPILFNSSLYNRFNSDDFQFIIKFYTWFDSEYNVTSGIENLTEVNKILERANTKINSLNDLKKPNVRQQLRDALLYSTNYDKKIIRDDIKGLKKEVDILGEPENASTKRTTSNNFDTSIYKNIQDEEGMKTFIKGLSANQINMLRSYLNDSNLK